MFYHLRYYGYREPPVNKYDRSLLFWKVLAVRLLFVFIFQVSKFASKCDIVQYIDLEASEKLSSLSCMYGKGRKYG